MRRYRLTLVLVLGLCPSLALAEPTNAELTHARRLFSEAVAAEDREEWALAASRLREAIEIKETPGLRFHLAYCEERQGHLTEALREYDRAEELLRVDPKAARDVARQLGPARDALRLRIPTITVELPAQVSNATLELDGRIISPPVFGKPIPQNPGIRTIKISSPGHVSFVRELVLSEGEAVVAMAELVPEPAPSTNNPAEPVASEADALVAPQSLRLRNWLLVTEGVIATAALGVGIGYQLAAASADRRAEDARVTLSIGDSSPNAQCGAPKSSVQGICDDLARAVSDGKSHRNVATIGFVGAGISAAAFVGTWLLWPSNAPSSGTALRVFPASSARGEASLIVTGAF